MGFECLILGTTEGETGDADVLNATSIKKDQIFLSQNSSVHQYQREVRILILSLVPLSNLICATPSAEMPYSSSFLCIYIAMAKNCSRNYMAIVNYIYNLCTNFNESYDTYYNHKQIITIALFLPPRCSLYAVLSTYLS
jgi:hypothetical protein